MDIVLIAGLWLDASAWDRVVPSLRALGHTPRPVSLPAGPDATLADQVAAVLAVVDACEAEPLVVGHSAASTLAWLAADARPTTVAGVSLVGGFPGSEGKPYADFFEPVDGLMPFPGWATFEGPDAADLSPELRAQIEAAAIPVPVGVSHGIVHLRDERRFGVPVTVVCPEYSPADAQNWIDAGDLPELARAETVRLVDLDSGHWPMFTKPAELAALLVG